MIRILRDIYLYIYLSISIYLNGSYTFTWTYHHIIFINQQNIYKKFNFIFNLHGNMKTPARKIATLMIPTGQFPKRKTPTFFYRIVNWILPGYLHFCIEFFFSKQVSFKISVIHGKSILSMWNWCTYHWIFSPALPLLFYPEIWTLRLSLQTRSIFFKIKYQRESCLFTVWFKK